MSDTTNERPGESGLYFYDGQPVMVTIMDGKPVIHFPLGGGFAANYMPTGTFEKAVPASELAALQADCERWSAMYARQADELVKLQALVDELEPTVSECDLVGKISTLTARLAEVQSELNCYRVTGGNFNPFEEGVRREVQILLQAKEAAETRVKELEAKYGNAATN